MRRLALVPAALAAVALAAALAAAPAVARPSRPVAVTVLARPGAADRLAHALGAGALRVERRNGRALQVLASPARVAALSRLPEAAGAHVAPSAFADETVGQGLDRTGASALEPLANGGKGLVIAILDLGFGTTWPLRQGQGDLPPNSRLEQKSFDAGAGLVGSNAYGNATNHGELVAQAVYDYAPNARYIFVNYHTTQDFLAATDWLAARAPNIVVHSNSFLEGPFDGTGAAAQAVDRLAAQGILWFNSAGNYAGKHWAGPWSDVNGDGTLDWGGAPLVFERGAGEPVSFSLSWENPPGLEPSDLDLILEQQAADGSWAPVAVSSDRQSAGAPPAERITAYSPPAAGLLRLRVVRVSGPPPTGLLTLFSREIDLGAIGDAVTSSLPTPGDADGSITVGATDWRGNTLKPYSSQGPTVDGRLKPDLVAPTNTSVAGPDGDRGVGGTSIAAPNAAGAAAVLWSAELGAGAAPTAASIRARLISGALDLGPPGPDPAFGAGLVRVDTDPPVIVPLSPAPGALVRGATRAEFQIDDPSRVASWSLFLDGSPLLSNRTTDPVAVGIATAKLPDGPHVLRVDARDWPGNAGSGEWRFTVDNSAPLIAAQVQVLPPPRPRLPSALTGGAAPPRAGARRRPPRPRPVQVTITARDQFPYAMRLGLRLTDANGATRLSRDLTLRAVRGRTLALGRYRPGRYRLALTLRDRAGNTRSLNRAVRVR